MKTINKILFAVCCMAAFTACSNDDDVLLSAEQPHEMSFTVNSGADTRTVLTVPEDGKGLKRVWKDGDKISVIFQKEVGGETKNYNEVFTLTSGAGTTSGTFSKSDSELPTSGTQTFHLLFPAGITIADYWVKTSIGDQKDGSLSTLGDYDILQAYNQSVTDGIFGEISLTGETSFLHIPTTVKLIDNATGEYTVSKLSMTGTSVSNAFLRSFTGSGSCDYVPITLSDSFTLKDGMPAKDIYIAFVRWGSIDNVSLTLTINGIDYKVLLNDPNGSASARIEHLAASSIKTLPSME